MKNKRTKLISVLLIVLCLSLCVGATYAYFTDSVTSSGNKIQAGNLKIDLELLNKETQEWNSIKTSQAPIFNYTLWEPGYTDVKLLKVENEGNLAIKWEARLVYEGTIPALAQAIEVYIKASETEFAYPATRAELDASWENVGNLEYFFNNISTILNGELLARESTYFGIELYMPTTVEDNTLQDQTIGEFDIQIVATQLTYEPDAFGTDYDEGARFPNGGATIPEETTPEETTPEVTAPDLDEPTNEPEPTDPDIFTWSENGDGTYTVTGLRWEATIPENLVIPSTYNGGAVTAIGDGAFDYEDTIESVVIPNSVTTIGNYAFWDCSSLTELTIGNGVTTIGWSAFEECTGLTSITIPDSVTTIGYKAFYGCSSLQSLTIGNGVTTIDESAFSWCSGLTKVVIGNNVITIDSFAFSSCTSLESVTIPNSVTTIGGYAFAFCDNLKNVTIPNSVTAIDSVAFGDCGSLESIYIPSSVTYIGGHAFWNCTVLTNIEFGGTVDQWNTINRPDSWNANIPATEVICTDKTIPLPPYVDNVGPS